MMNLSTKNKIITGIAGSLSMFLVMSCSNSPVEENYTDIVPEQTIVASVAVGDEGMIQFIEEEPGCLVTAGSFSSKDYLPAYETMNPVELYEVLKGEDAPVALKQAYRNALAKQSDDAITDVPELPESTGEEALEFLPKTAMSGTVFSQNYCYQPGYDFASCRINRRSNTSFFKTCSYMRSFTNADTGNVTFVAQWYNYSTHAWVTAKNYPVLEGHTYYYAVAGSKKPRIFKVLMSSQWDWFHFSVMGNYELD